MKISLDFKEHGIGYFLPAGGRQEGHLTIPYGALIGGDYIGDILCEQGSVIILGRFKGRVEADRIYVVGEVGSSSSARSQLIGRKLVAASKDAKINADLYARAFTLHKSNVWGSLNAFEQAQAERLLLSAHSRADSGRRAPPGDPARRVLADDRRAEPSPVPRHAPTRDLRPPPSPEADPAILDSVFAARVEDEQP